MSFEYLADSSSGPAWKGLLPGRPEPYFLKRGEGEHAMLFADLFTVLLTGDETEGQFGVFTSQAPRGQLIPAHAHHRTNEVFYIVERIPALLPASRTSPRRSVHGRRAGCPRRLRLSC